jgi:secernin
MCDTFVAAPSATEKNIMIFAKNSDREPNEAQNVTFYPAMDHDPDTMVKCTYIEIPQKEHTNAVILSRPFWMFGAEMGVNEHGVVIGNEAVFTREKYSKKDVLTGMDILRLSLERSKTSDEARNTIIALIDRFGQGGNCSMDGKLYYHNSFFIIADADKAMVLETAGNQWVSKEVQTVDSISNCLTIESDFSDSSEELTEYARKKGYTGKDESVNFKEHFSDRFYTYFARGRTRRSCTYSNLNQKKGSITIKDMINFLRDHNTDDEFIVGKIRWNPSVFTAAVWSPLRQRDQWLLH